MWYLRVYLFFFALDPVLEGSTVIYLDQVPVHSEAECHARGDAEAQKAVAEAQRREILPPESMKHPVDEYRAMVVCKAPE